MRQISTDYGTLQVGTLDETFCAIVDVLREAVAAKGGADHRRAVGRFDAEGILPMGGARIRAD